MAKRAQPRAQSGTPAGGQFARKYTADTLQEAINTYLSECQAKDMVPLWEELLPRLGLSRQTWDTYGAPDISDQQRAAPDDDVIDKVRTAEIVKNTELILSGGLIRAVLGNQKTSAIGIFLLKQKHYGGYSDAPQVNLDATIKIKVDGCGDGAAE